MKRRGIFKTHTTLSKKTKKHLQHELGVGAAVVLLGLPLEAAKGAEVDVAREEGDARAEARRERLQAAHERGALGGVLGGGPVVDHVVEQLHVLEGRERAADAAGERGERVAHEFGCRHQAFCFCFFCGFFLCWVGGSGV